MSEATQPAAEPEHQSPSARNERGMARDPSASSAGAAAATAPSSSAGRALGESELDSALQLLVERAQYITGATGAALALPEASEMVCRASAGRSAPAVGARLQVRAGLSAESIARRQLLRCNNAETDPRVNLEACRALGIASIVVLPLLRNNGEVRGLFELFSDHAYAFEERDLVALERMAELTLTALDLAEQRQAPAVAPVPEAQKAAEVATASSEPPALAPGLIPKLAETLLGELSKTSSDPAIEDGTAQAEPASTAEPASEAVPEAMLRVKKCAACGFPVSEARTLCLDCEKKEDEKREAAKCEGSPARDGEQAAGSAPAAPPQEDFVPAFLANSSAAQESWLKNPVNLLAIIVVILGILVAIVVFHK